MEYVISTRKFNSGEKKNNLYFWGDFDYTEESTSILEGEVIRGSDIKTDSWHSILTSTYIGNFNYIRYDQREDKILVKNDKLGTYALYVYNDGETLLLSNNVWRIIKLLNSNEIKISKKNFKFVLGSWGVNLDGGTLFENIIEINAGSNVIIQVDTRKQTVNKYFSLLQRKDEFPSLKEATDILDSDLGQTFDRISEKNKGMIMGFGNSGGLDSRLVPIYAAQSNIKSVGITTVNKKPKGIFESITVVNAKKIAKAFGVPNYFISHVLKRNDERMALDIRNNPFGPTQILKNAFYDVPQFDYYVTGGNGFIVGGAWEKFLNIKSESELRDSFLNYHAKFNAYTWDNGSKQLIDLLFSKEDKEFINNQKLTFFEEHKHKDRLSLIRSFHQYSMNKRSPAGGFESMNRLYKTYNIYYPIVFENTLNWNPEFFPGRSVLKNLIKKKSPLLYNIPSQNYNRLDDQPLNVKGKVIRRLANKYRDMGLDYNSWVLQQEFTDYAKAVFTRENDLFYNLLGISMEEFLKLDVIKNLTPHVSLDFLKLKKILDIVEYEEFDFVYEEKFNLK